jgi:hypothetical protein
MKQLTTALVVAGLLTSVQARAVTLTIEPDDYTPGTAIGPTPDAAVSYVNHNDWDNFLTYTAAIAATEPSCTVYTVCKAPTGTVIMSDGRLVNGVLQPGPTLNMTAMFVGLLDNGTGPVQLTPTRLTTMRYFRGIRLDFTVPTDSVSVDLYNTTDLIRAFAFDASGTLLSITESSTITQRQMAPNCTFPSACLVWEQTKSVTRPAADISFIILGSSSSAAYPDAVRFNVP